MAEQRPLEDLGLDELEAMLEKPEVPSPEEEAEPEPAEPSESEAPPEQEPEGEAKPEPAQEEQKPEPSEDLDAEILRARLEAAEAAAKKWEQVAGRHGGELGFLKNRMREIEGRIQTLRSEQEPIEPSDLPQPDAPRTPSPGPRTDPLATWAVNQAIAQASADFMRTHPDMGDMKDDFEQYLKNSNYNAADLIGANDPIWAASETNRLLEEAYWNAKQAFKQRVASALEKRKADQVPRLDQAKRKAAISASGAAPAPKPQVKPLSDMSLEELEKELKRLTKR